jgi:hypothetical protein
MKLDVKEAISRSAMLVLAAALIVGGIALCRAALYVGLDVEDYGVEFGGLGLVLIAGGGWFLFCSVRPRT